MNKIIFLDVETTGTEKHDRLCQLCYKEKGQNDYFSSYFKPPVPITIEAMSITHITNEMVEDWGPFKGSDEYIRLEELINNDAIIVAHNAQFDVGMLEKEGINPKKVICTMKLAHLHDEEGKLGKHNLQYLRYFYKLDVGEVTAHDASGDVAVLEALYNFYAQYYSVEAMLEISSKPILLKVFPFGKYKKEKFEDVIKKDKPYFDWVKFNVDMDENLKYTINYYLKNSK